MTSYRKYNELGNTQAEKMQQQIAQQKAMQAQATIEKQQALLEEQQKKLEDQRKQIVRSSRIAQQAANSRAQLAYNQNKNRKKNANPTPTGAVRVTTKDQKHKQIWSNEICVFKISAPWCEPCKVLAPKYDALAKLVNSSGLIMLCAEELDDKFSADVEGVPAIDYYFRGNKIKRQMGADFNETRRHVRSLINQAKSLNSQSRARLDSPHPAAGMQPQRPVERPQVGSFPPSARRM